MWMAMCVYIHAHILSFPSHDPCTKECTWYHTSHPPQIIGTNTIRVTSYGLDKPIMSEILRTDVRNRNSEYMYDHIPCDNMHYEGLL